MAPGSGPSIQVRRLRQVAKSALARYGIESTSITLLVDHCHNTTFAITAADGARYVLHLLRTLEDTESEPLTLGRVQSEVWWLDRVRADLDLSVPVIVRTASDEDVFPIDMGIAVPTRLCMLFRWVDGRFLYHRLTSAHLEMVGSVTARLHQHSKKLSLPAAFNRPIVDRADDETEEAMVGLFADHVSNDAATVVRTVFYRVREMQQVLGSETGTFGLIHADIHQKNYLFRGREMSLIDFGDCGFGHYLYDLAVTIHQLHALPHSPELRVAFLAGYRQIADLSPEHEALIDTCMMLREVQDHVPYPQERGTVPDATWIAQAVQGIAFLEGLLDNS